MSITASVIMGATIVTALAAGVPPARAVTRPTLFLHIVDYASVPSGAITRAQQSVVRVFGLAGINIAWREEPVPAASLGPDHVTVLILSSSMAKQKCDVERIPPDILGSAAPAPVRRAWVLYDRIAEAADIRPGSLGFALGHVIAHEAAHAVAAISHSEHGIMERGLKISDEGFVAFTAPQSERIRAALRGISPNVMPTFTLAAR
jgi:hypothetical protein